MFNTEKVNEMRRPPQLFQQDSILFDGEDWDDLNKIQPTNVATTRSLRRTTTKKGKDLKQKKKAYSIVNKSIVDEWRENMDRKMLDIVYKYTRKEKDEHMNTIDYGGI